MFYCCGGRLNELRRDILQNDLVGLKGVAIWAVEVVDVHDRMVFDSDLVPKVDGCVPG